MLVTTASIEVAIMGTVGHDESIESYVFTAGQDFVCNARTFVVAANGIVNRKSIATYHRGGGSVMNDSGSINICAGGSIFNCNSINNVVCRPGL